MHGSGGANGVTTSADFQSVVASGGEQLEASRRTSKF